MKSVYLLGALSNYQNNRAAANIDALRKIAQYFNASSDWLIGLSGAPSPSIDIQEIHKKTGLWESAIVQLFTDSITDGTAVSDFISYLIVNSKISELIAAVRGKNRFSDGQRPVTIDVDGEQYFTEMQSLFKMEVSDLFLKL